MNEVNAAVAAHYGSESISERILTALSAAGLDIAALTVDDLRPVDQFHVGGQPATRALARLAEVRAGLRVLDVGGGIGGPARTLASDHGCHVTVLDLSAPFCEAGEMLTARTGLSHLVAFQQGDAQALPFADGAFDLVWTQHLSMNVPDKRMLYAEIARVLRPGGRLALHEVTAGAVQPVHYPVPWAREPAQSFLIEPDALRSLLTAHRFREVAWQDDSADDAEWFRAMQARAAAGSGRPGLGVHVLLGSEFPTMGRNVLRNLDEGRIHIIRAVFDRS